MTHRIRNQFILLTGISGSGKSRYGEHLQQAYGFRFIETDEDDRVRTEAVRSNAGFVARYLNESDHIAMEWGFLPQSLGCVLKLKEQGARLLWFRADDVIARSAYFAKWLGSPDKMLLWDIQRERIREACLPTSDFQIVETFRDGNFRPYDELDEECLGNPYQGG